MKIAVIFGGRVKGFMSVFEQLKKIKNENTDFYISCGTDKESYDSFIKEFNIPESNCFWNTVPIPKEFNSFTIHHPNKLENCSSMFYHNKMAFELIKKSGRKYDVVLKYRADINIENFIRFKEYDINAHTVYIPSGNDFGGINDQIAYGLQDSMEIYCKTFDNILKIYNDGCIFHPETLLLKHLQRENINIIRFPLNWNLIKNRW